MSGDIQMRRQPGGGLKLKNNRKKRPEQALQDPSVASFAGMGEISVIKAMCSTGPGVNIDGFEFVANSDMTF